MKRGLVFCLILISAYALGQSRIIPKKEKSTESATVRVNDRPTKDVVIPANLPQREKDILELGNLERRGEFAKAAELAYSIGQSFREDKIVQKTTEFLRKAAELAKKSNNDQLAAKAMELLGDNFFAYNFYDDAYYNFKEAAKIFKKLNDKDKTTSLLMKMGDCFAMQRDPQKAADEYEKAFKLSEEKHPNKIRSAKLLIKTYKQLGKTEKVATYEEYIASLTQNKKVEEVAPDVIQKEQEAILIKEATILQNQKEIEEQARALESGQLSNEEKAQIEAQLKARQLENELSKKELEKFKEELEQAKLYNQELKDVNYLIEEKAAKFKTQVFLVGIGVSLLLISFAIFFIYIRRANHQIKEKNRELSLMNNKIQERNQIIELEKQKSEELLLNILPVTIANELKEKGSVTPKHYDMVTVLFTDFKGFTSIAEHMSPTELINELNTYFSVFDSIIKDHNLEKIKTIGDAYMCAGGLPEPNQTNPVDAILAALKMSEYVREQSEKRRSAGRPYFDIRIGIHTGPLVAGVVGTKKFIYDIWGDTVNTASRMESSGEVGKVNVSGVTQALTESYFEFSYRGKIAAKNKEPMDMYFVESLKTNF
jgi:class 3 adenylate cyclase